MCHLHETEAFVAPRIPYTKVLLPPLGPTAEDYESQAKGFGRGRGKGFWLPWSPAPASSGRFDSQRDQNRHHGSRRLSGAATSLSQTTRRRTVTPRGRASLVRSYIHDEVCNRRPCVWWVCATIPVASCERCTTVPARRPRLRQRQKSRVIGGLGGRGETRHGCDGMCNSATGKPVRW